MGHLRVVWPRAGSRCLALVAAEGSAARALIPRSLPACGFRQYLTYAMTWALGPSFLAFVALHAASLAATACLVATIDVAALSRGGPGKIRRRGVTAPCLILSLALVGMWLKRLVAGLSLAAARPVHVGQRSGHHSLTEPGVFRTRVQSRGTRARCG
jgi:hypothetical protein